MPSVFSGTKLTPAQIKQDAATAGFSGQSLNTISAIAEAESGGYTGAQQWGPWQNGVDRGIVQINSYYHPDVTNQAAYDPVQAFSAAFKISSGGTNFQPWTTFTSGAYKSNLPLFTPTPTAGGALGGTSTATGTPVSIIPSKQPSFWLVLLGAALALIGLIVILQPSLQQAVGKIADVAKVAAA